MFAVIFKAKMNKVDDEYFEFAKQLRELAFIKYGCTEFVSASEADLEIAISYWQSEADILAWKQDVKHLTAQKFGQERWYESYEVEIVKLVRSYQFPPQNNSIESTDNTNG